MKTPTPRILSRSIATLAAAGILACIPSTHAATLYWDNAGGTADDWSSIPNWSTDIAGGVDPLAIPGAADIASFAASSVATPQTVNLNADRSVLGLEFISTQAHSLLGGGTNRVLTLGASGINMTAAATAAMTIGSATAGQNVAITLGAAQSWTNNSTSLLTITNGVTNGANLLTITGTGNTSILGVVGNGAGGVAKTGNGLLTLSGANTYTGATTITAGTVRATVAGALGAGALSLGGGTLQLANDAATAFNRNTTVTASSAIVSDRATSGAGVTHTLGTLSIGAQTLTISNGTNVASGTGGVTFGNATMTGASTFTVNAGSLLTLSGTLANGGFLATVNGAGSTTIAGIVSGAGGFTKTGTGTLTLSGVNTYTGATSVLGGTLLLTVAAPSGAAGALGNATSTVLVGDTTGALDASVVTNAAVTIARTFTVQAGNTGNITIGGSGGNASTFSGTVTLNKSANLTAIAAGTATFSGVVSGVGGVTKTGAGTVVLSAANTYSGGTTVADGVLQLNNNTAAGTGAISVSAGGTVATRISINGGVTIANNVSFGNTTNAAGLGVLQQTGTGLATVNGTINVTGVPTAGGHFVGGNATGNALVLNGVITSTVALSQRDGFVRYSGGGTGYTALGVTNTAQVGATNGISTLATVSLGASGAATLDLNGFDQTLAGLQFGVAANNSTVAIGARTLTLTGNISTASTATHAIAGTGTLALGANPASITVADGNSVNDLTIAPSISGTAGITKAGTGVLALNGANTFTGGTQVTAGELTGSGSLASGITLTSSRLSGTLTVAGTIASNAGSTISPGILNPISGASGIGTLTSTGLTFGAGATTLNMDVGATGDVLVGGTVQALGTTTVNAFQIGGALANGTYNLIAYTGATPGLAGFTLAPVGHATASLVDTGSAIALSVTGNDRVIWDGTNTTAWATGTTGNWKLQSNSAVADFIASDDVIFQDTPTSATVDIGASVMPSNVRFTNTVATTYTVTGAAGITGTTGLTKTGNGTVVLRTQNGYTGATTVSAGTLELDHDATGNQVLTATSGVSVASGATLRITRDGAAAAATTTFTRDITGAGALDINIRTGAAAAAADSIVLTGNNTGFSGTMRLLAPATGTYRLNQPNLTQIGTGPIEVQSGAQLYTAGNLVYPNAITISGTGFADSAGNIGALRLENGATWSGPIVVSGSARIGAHNSTATVSGNISGGDLTVNATNFNNSYTLIFTGANSYGQTIIGGQNTQTAGVPSMRLNIGNGGTTGTLGAGNVIINGDGANGVLGFDRSNGYTLAAGQTITGAGTSPTRVFLDLDTLGTGFNDNGSTITLGGITPGTGGNVRIGQARANTVTNLTGAMTAEKIAVSSAANNATLNINAGAVINTNFFTIGETANATGGVVNQNGGTVNVLGQLRAGHFGTETGTYNMLGGTLTLTGASPTQTPSTAGAGGANATGDNNINGGATATIHGGGIYLGIDGTGVFNQTGGTVTTNWIVLDNRGDNGAAANMADGIDRYNLSGASSVLNIRSTYGLIQRNASAAVSFGGGTVRVDNTGTGTGTGANITIPLDATIDTVASTTTNLDTNGAGNGISLLRDVRGTGTLNLTGGGTVNVSNTSFQKISAALTGSTKLTKLGTGVTTLTGNGSGYTGAVTVSAGRLNVSDNLAAASITVADGAAIGGEATTAALNLGTTTGSSIFFNPNTAGALTGTALTVAGANTVDFAAVPTGAGPYTVLNYTTKAGAGTFALANAASYRVAPVVADTGTSITVNVTGTKALTWTGTGGATWNVNTTTNWNNTTPAADVFFAADTVTFDDSSAVAAVTVTPGVSPWKTTVSSNTTNYTLTSTGAGIAGPGNLEKSGNSTLTLAGANTYAGQTVIGGGTVAIAAATSLGNASVTNGLTISGGGRLSYTAATALDLGINRNITVGAGGGSISHNNGTGATITIPGNLTGSGTDNLSFHSNAAGPGTFVLTGDNSGYTGRLSVDSSATVAAGLTTLRIGTQSAAPTSGSITVNFPAAATTNVSTTLDLPGITLPAAVGLTMNSFVTGTNVSQRTQITSVGNSTVNGTVSLIGNAGAVVQMVPTNGTLTFNGNFVEATPGSFGTAASLGVLFFRNTGNTVINGTINLPNATVVRVDDTGITTINSTGNVWALSDVRSNSTLRIGADNALAIGATLNIGQSTDGSASIFELNGFNQEVNGLTSIAGNASNARRVTNSSTTLSTLTLNGTVDRVYGNSTGNTGGNLTGNLAIVKNGTYSQTIAGPANTYTGNVTVNAGTLVAGGGQNSNALGSPTTAGRTVTVNNSGTALSFTTNNVYGNGVGNANLPSTTLNAGTTLTSTRYNVLGPITLNGATLTQSATDAGLYEGFQFKGTVTIGGTSVSTISTGNGKANHLDANTTFNVADAVSGAGADLVVSAPLRDQSGDFASAVGGLTKTGAGSMVLSAINTYTGATVVNAGTLVVDGSIAGSATTVNTGGTVSGGGILGALNLAGGTLAPGNSPGILSSGNTTFGGGAFSLEILGTTPGVGAGNHDQLAVTGTITFTGNVALTIDLGVFNPADNVDTFTIVSNDATDAITLGGFGFSYLGNQLTEGEFFAVGSQTFSISYAGGSNNNDVVLAAVPEPSSALAAIGGLAMLSGLRRFRRRA